MIKPQIGKLYKFTPYYTVNLVSGIESEKEEFVCELSCFNEYMVIFLNFMHRGEKDWYRVLYNNKMGWLYFLKGDKLEYANPEQA